MRISELKILNKWNRWIDDEVDIHRRKNALLITVNIYVCSCNEMMLVTKRMIYEALLIKIADEIRFHFNFLIMVILNLN